MRGAAPIRAMSVSNATDGYVPITSVHRADLEGLGYDVSNVDDVTMERLANKMADAYLEHVHWLDLPNIANDLGIPKREEGH